MKNCININHPDVTILASELNLPKIVVAAKIGVWQEEHNIYDRFPTTEELFTNSIINKNIVKPGVKELFDSNPTLANQVYEVLGYMTVYRTGEYNPNDKTFFVSPTRGTWDKISGEGETKRLFTKKLYIPLSDKTFNSWNELRTKAETGEFTEEDTSKIFPEESGIQHYEQYEVSPQDLVDENTVKQQALQLYSNFLSNFVDNNFDTIIQDLQTKNILDKKCS